MGEWKTPPFMAYMDVSLMEAEAVMQAHLDDESDDGEEESVPRLSAAPIVDVIEVDDAISSSSSSTSESD